MSEFKSIHGTSSHKHNAPRRRGAQTHNYNAFKHGLYSKRFSPLSAEALANLDISNVEEEIQVIRIMIARHLEMRVNNPPSSAEESLTDLRVISFAVARLASLMRLRKNLPEELPESDDWMDDLLGDALADESPGRCFREFPNDPNTPIQ
jgi:hypothetical protein